MNIFATILLQSGSPFDDLDFIGPAPPPPEINWGMLVFWVFLGFAQAVLFGLWGRAKAEEHDVNPWIGFIAGFFFSYIGVRVVRYLRSDRLFYTPRPATPHQWRAPLRPVNAPAPVGQPSRLPVDAEGGDYPQQAITHDAHGFPAPSSDVSGTSGMPEDGPTEQPTDPNQFESVESTPQTPPAAPQLDAFGFIICPGCGGRVKQGRKRCGSCGANL